MLDRALDIESCVREAEEATSSSSSSVNDSFTPSDIPIGNCSRLNCILFSRVPSSFGRHMNEREREREFLFERETEHLWLRQLSEPAAGRDSL